MCSFTRSGLARPTSWMCDTVVYGCHQTTCGTRLPGSSQMGGWPCWRPPCLGCCFALWFGSKNNVCQTTQTKKHKIHFCQTAKKKKLFPQLFRMQFVFRSLTWIFPPPTMETIMDFVNLTGPFAGAGAYQELDPGKFWTLYQIHVSFCSRKGRYAGDSALSNFARITALLPSSTADLERVWSVAGSVSGHRRQALHTNNHAQELFVRWNCVQLRVGAM